MLKPLSVVAMTIALAGCAVGPNFKVPCDVETDKYIDNQPKQTVGVNGSRKNASRQQRSQTSLTGAAGKVQHFLSGEDIPGEWWRLFHSPALDCLIKKGLANSPTVKAAEASLRQAQENWNDFYGAAFFPAVSGSFSGTRQKVSSAAFGGDGPEAGGGASRNLFNLFNASVNVTYALDFFGVNRRQLEAFAAQIDYKTFQLEATYLSLTSNIATTAINEASFREQLAATRELIALYEKQLSITEKQFELGAVSRTDTLQQQTQIYALRATIPALELQLAKARHNLAVLIGELPSENCLPTFSLADLNLPGKLPISLPSLLSHQRPDVRASEALLHKASAEIGVATANLFPQISLSSSYGTQSNRLQDLFKCNSIIWNYGGQLLQPIFNGGSLQAKRCAAVAAFDEAAAIYRQTVLLAFQNVADTLRALETDARALRAQTEAEISAQGSVNIIRKQYQLGAIRYADLLIAEQQLQTAKIKRIQAAAARYSDTVALFQALGGGWWNRDC